MHKQRRRRRRRMSSQLVHDVPVVGVASPAAATATAIVIDVVVGGRVGAIAFNGVLVDMIGAESGRGLTVSDGTSATARRRMPIARRHPTRTVMDGSERWLGVRRSSEASNRRADDRAPAPRLGRIATATTGRRRRPRRSGHNLLSYLGQQL